jgi:DNA anti-recombination protein RmuC
LLQSNQEDKDRLQKELSMKETKFKNQINSMMDDHKTLRDERNKHLNNLFDIKKAMANGMQA